MPPRSNSLDSFNFAMRHRFRKRHHVQIIETTSIFYLQWATTSMCTLLIQLGQAESANYSYSELSYMSAKLYRSSVGWQCIVQGAICRGPRQLRLRIACNATDTELHDHTYAVGAADIAACEGSPHNVLHSSSLLYCVVLCLWPSTCTSLFKGSSWRPRNTRSTRTGGKLSMHVSIVMTLKIISCC